MDSGEKYGKAEESYLPDGRKKTVSCQYLCALRLAFAVLHISRGNGQDKRQDKIGWNALFFGIFKGLCLTKNLKTYIT